VPALAPHAGMSCGASQGVTPSPSTHCGVVWRLVRGEGGHSGEAVSGHPRGLGSQKEKGKQEAILLCLPSGLPPGSCSCGAPQGSVSSALQICRREWCPWWDVADGGMRVKGDCWCQGLSRKQEGRAGGRQPGPLSFGYCSFLESLCPERRCEKKQEKK